LSIPISSPPNLKDRVAIVTGSGSGIGKAACAALAREGAKVVACYRSDSSVWQVSNEYKDQIFFFKCDITIEDQVKSLVQFARDKFKRIDILVNSAGVVSKTPITELDEAEWDMVMDINVKGTFLCCKHIMKIMQEQKAGKIICLGSISGKIGGLVTGPHYVASKAAVHGLTKWIARNGAEHGILANCIIPGQIQTPMFAKLGLSDIKIPVGRLGEPEDVAELVIFLASDASNFITGAMININGGILMDG